MNTRARRLRFTFAFSLTLCAVLTVGIYGFGWPPVVLVPLSWGAALVLSAINTTFFPTRGTR